ncbi:MAG TPA: metalloregulator ArsR/SmtB family transcription factor [Ktedonobacteraceae bacterium]
MYSDNEQKSRGLSAIEPDVVEELRATAPADELVTVAAEMFHVLGDPTRLKMLYLLMKHDCCVRDLAILVGVSESAISHQLKLLKDRQLVKARREGTTMYYSLADHHLGPLFREAESHANHITQNLPDHSHP